MITLLVVLLAGHLPESSASTIEVTSSGNSGDGTLRGVIASAYSGDTIVFNSSALPTITLTSEIQIDKNLTIDGPGAASLTISGGNSSRIFFIDADYTVTISNLTISNGNSGQESGGGILNQGKLTLSNCVVTGNISNSYGGGISNYSGILVVENSTISLNTATTAGGGIYNVNGMLTVAKSTINGNSAGSAGGIMNTTSADGTAATYLVNSTISGNTATVDNGGGIVNQFLVSGGELKVGDGLPGPPASPFSNGGGFPDTPMFPEGFPDTPESPFPGGGTNQTAKTIIYNCTITNNTSTGKGGGIYGYQSGITAGLSDVEYRNTILAGNNAAAGKDCYNENGIMKSLGYSLLGVTVSCNGGSGDITIGTGIPKLGPLANNGGSTLTHALLTGSLAINAGSADVVDDQRGTSRP